MLTTMRKAINQSSMSKPFGASDESCSPSKNGSPPTKNQNQDMITRDYPQEIQAAQQILARIAVKILTRRKTDEEKETNKSDVPINNA
jgi:3-oxoacyl-ACP reductase-like protein